MATTAAKPDFGVGIYSFPSAARIIGRKHTSAHAETLRRWLTTGLTPPSFREARRDGYLLSFHDLVSLELVRRFRDEGVSLQKMRRLEQRLKIARPDLARPFAHRIFFTDGSAIWASLEGRGSPVVELVGPRPDQMVWTPAIEAFAAEITFDEEGAAAAWMLSEWVEIDPDVQFGEPVVRGTRTPISVIEADLSVADSAEVADWHGLALAQIAGVQDFLHAA